MTPTTPSRRADLHCHSTASQVSKLGVQRSAGLPECATPPEEVYELAKRRGMDFVTITDHDTIDGALEIADRPDVFISEELTASFAGEPQAVHVLCFGITPDDHEWLQSALRGRRGVRGVPARQRIACALAHPFYAVAAPLEPRHRRRLARAVRGLGDAQRLPRPRAQHAGRRLRRHARRHRRRRLRRPRRRRHRPDLHRYARAADEPEEFLAHIRAGRAEADGKQGSAAKWTHAAIALATRSLLMRAACSATRRAPTLGPAAARARRRRGQRALRRRRRRVHARRRAGPADRLARLGRAPERPGADRADAGGGLLPREPLPPLADCAHDLAPARRPRPRPAPRSPRDRPSLGRARRSLRRLHAGRPLPARRSAFLANERARLTGRDGRAARGSPWSSTAIDAPHGVAHTIERIRELGVPGFEVEVIGTDRGVDRGSRRRRGRDPLLRGPEARHPLAARASSRR